MIEFERLIDDIKHALLVESQPLQGEAHGEAQAQRVAALAGSYQDKCQLANERVRECSQLLRRGLRSEALQMAEQEPNLIDLVVLLDFADRAQWCELLRRYDLPLPPELMIDVAADLNTAYALEQPLVVLLKKHRLQALSHSPLKLRIATLKEIAKADPANGVWNEDLLKFEKVRHAQIQSEGQAAAKSMTLDVLAELEQELIAPDWRAPPPAPLVQWTHQRHAQMRTSFARNELTQLATKLLAAHSALDLGAARQWRNQWQARLTFADLNDSDPLARRSAPALAWLAAEDAREADQADYEAALAELTQALDSEVSAIDLEQFYGNVACHEQGVPEALESRARARMAALERAASRRSRLIYSAIALGVLCLGGVVAAGVSFKSHRDAVHASTEMVRTLLAQNRLTAAREYLDQLTAAAPRVAAASEILAVSDRLRTLQTEENQRQAAFRSAMEAAEAAASFEHPTLDSLAASERQLRREVTPLATIRRDQAELLALEQRIAQARSKIQKQLDEAFDARFKPLLVEQARLETSSDPTINTALAAQIRQIGELLTDSGQVSSERVDRLHDLQLQTEKLEKTFATRERMARQVAALTAAIGNIHTYQAALTDYVRQFPTSPRASAFQQAEQEHGLWQAVIDWRAYRTDWQQISWSDLEPEAAAGLLKDAQALLSKSEVAALPFTPALRQRLPYLQAVVNRGPGAAELIKPLSAFFTNRAITGLRLLQLREPGGKLKNYYLQEPAKRQELTGRLSFRYVADLEFNTKHASVAQDAVVVPPGADGAADAPAPQSVLAQDALNLLANHASWEQTFFTILEHVDQNQTLDPVLKMLILLQVTDAASKGSVCLEKAFAPLREQLDQANVLLTANWLNPDDADASAERAKAADVLRRLPDLKRVKQAAADDLRSVRAQLPGNLHWVGCLLEDGPSAGWRCALATESRPAPACDLVVVFRSDPLEPVQVKTIGRLDAGRVTLRSAADGLRDGRPVFAQLPE